MIDPIRGSIWKSKVNSLLGSIFLGSVALWAALSMFHAVWNINPVENAFAAVIAKETQLP